MLRVILAIIQKDLTLLISRGSALVQALLLGLILVFVFSLAQDVGEHASAQTAAAIFWMSSLFCQVLLFNQLYGLEEVTQARVALLLLPVAPQTIFLAKTITGLLLLLVAQAVFLPAGIVFLFQSLEGSMLLGLVSILAVDVGLTTIGSLLGQAAQGQISRESLVSILVFPLVTPILLAGIRLLTITFSGEGDPSSWSALTLAFDAVFMAAATVLSPFIQRGDDA